MLQIDPTESFVSDSPYTSKLGLLDCVHKTVDAENLISIMQTAGYALTHTDSSALPNGKIFKRLDFKSATPTAPTYGIAH